MAFSGGQVNANIIPATTGLALGNQSQQWLAYLSNVFIQGPIASLTVNPASVGFLRLASTDQIAWRSNDNGTDYTLGTSGVAVGTIPADVLIYNGPAIEGTFLTSTALPAAAGALRLAAADTVNFRNQANSADIVALAHNSDDTISVGGTAGIDVSAINNTGNSTIIGNEAVTGNLTVTGTAATGAITAPSVTAPSTLPLSLSASDQTGSFAGSNVTITAGAAGGSPANHAGGSIVLTGGAGTGVAGHTGTLQTNTAFSVYNGINTVNNGIASEVASVKLTAQTAAVGTTTLYAVPAAGLFRLCWSAKITTAATTGSATSTLGALTIVYTDPDGVTVTLTCGAMTTAGAIATTSTTNTTAVALIGLPLTLNCAASTNVTYAFSYASNTANQMAYNLNLVLEAF